MGDPSLVDVLDVALEAAWAGGRRTLAHFNNGVAVETKPDGTIVTVADRESERAIRAVIGRAFPDHGILGEEEGETKGTAGYRWIVDPLDGTRTFARGVPLYGVLIGVEVAGETAVGVIYMPALDEMVWAATGQGCRWNGRPARVSPASSLDRALLVATDEKFVRTRSPAYGRLAARAGMVRTWADCYGYLLVATGRAEVAVDPKMAPWDAAALLPIIEEAGGRATDWRGKRTAWGGDLVATNGVLHDEVLGLLAGS